MRTSALACVLCLVAACGKSGIPNYQQPDSGNPHGGDAGEQTQGCLSDGECGGGQVCVNCDGTGACTPGCRADAQCGVREICQMGTVCQTCPCPPGWCVLDPCRDEDNDGFVPGDDPTVTCPGKQKGDCDDRSPEVHPGAVEQCRNYRDDDCDNRMDERDDDCVCPQGLARCGNSFDCGGLGTQGCTKGCCDACNTSQKPTCSWGVGYCAQPYGTNPYTGCSYGWTCQSCSGCPNTVDPVCGVNGSTYDNACLMGQRNVRQLHAGPCVPGEGVYCDGQVGTNVVLDGGCDPAGELYCRGSCPTGTSCGFKQCTKKGVCLVDADCPAGLPPPPPADCDGGTPALRCVLNACVSVCG